MIALVTSSKTWQRLFELVCRQLHQRDPGRFVTLFESRDFISSHGHHIVTHDAQALRKALQIDNDLYIECNLSANGIRDMIRRLLVAFDVPSNQLQLFLRQDRDAARPSRWLMPGALHPHSGLSASAVKMHPKCHLSRLPLTVNSLAVAIGSSGKADVWR